MKTNQNARQKDQEGIKRLAEWLDSKYELPFGIKVGWDGLIGMIPGVGDVITSLLSLYVVYQGVRLGCPPTIIMRMGLNILIENMVDVIPVLGNLFDIYWKANNRNVALIEGYQLSPEHAQKQSRRVLIFSLVVFILIIGLCISLAVFVTLWFVSFLRSWF